MADKESLQETENREEKIETKSGLETTQSVESVAENKIAEIDRTSQETIGSAEQRLDKAKAYYELSSEKADEILASGGFKERVAAIGEQITSLADSSKEKIAGVIANPEQKNLHDINIEQILKSGQEKIHAMYSGGQAKSSEYQALSAKLMKKVDGKNAWKSADEVDIEAVKKLLDAGTVRYENDNLATQERASQTPELLSKKEASKKFFSAERKQLAQVIQAARRAQRERLDAIKGKIETSGASENIDDKELDFEYGNLSESQSEESNVMADRLSIEEGLSETDAQEEEGNISKLISNSESIKSIKEKLEEHYVKADAAAKEHFDTLNRSLENVIKRNNVFIVHKITEEVYRHALSNVSSETTYEDDIDILLSLEPSISASSLTPGKKARLWPGESGFLLGGGQIGEAKSYDAGTNAQGIKKRGGENSSIEKIDEAVGRKDELSRKTYERYGEHDYNEVVVNNPEVFGFFQHAGVDEVGRFWAYNLKTKDLSEEAVLTKINTYRERFSVAEKRGIPLYIMTEDRNVYECQGVNDDGTIEVGKQLTPEEVATGRAGLSDEKRKQIGERLLQKKVFRAQETQEEARKIVESL